jgi:hypothetical protein
MQASGTTMRYFRLIGTALAVMTTVNTGVSSQETAVATRIIEEDIRVRLPLLPCTVPAATIRIAESLSVPLGLELVPEPCGEKGKAYPDRADEIVLTGMSVLRAFDRLVELDERYVWSEADGVLVLRPGVTWFDSDHFLNRRIPFFRVKDGRIWGAVAAVHSALGGVRGPADEVWPARTPQGNRMFSISLGATTVVDALNAVARAHGSLRWTVEYCKPQARYEYAMVRLSTFDGDGIGQRSATQRADGTWSDACASTK